MLSCRTISASLRSARLPCKSLRPGTPKAACSHTPTPTLIPKNPSRLPSKIDLAQRIPFALIPLTTNVDSTPSIWLSLGVLTGLPVALWMYKCLMLVAFQRKIIYMGYVPPGARSEELSRDVLPSHLIGLSCEEIQLQTDSKAKLVGILVRKRGEEGREPDVVIMYLQGNAGNPLHRLPVFQRLLRTHVSSSPSYPKSPAILAIAPRSFWKSTPRRPTQRGILEDYKQGLHYALSRFPSAGVVIYGHSLGGAAAVCLLANLSERSSTPDPEPERERSFERDYARIRGLILENPILSIPEMVRVLYPSRYIPYYHLGALAIDKWDAYAALSRAVLRHDDPTACQGTSGSVLRRLAKDMLVLVSENDEVVPKEMGTCLADVAFRERDAARGKGGRGRLVVINGALHENAWESVEWAKEVWGYLSGVRTSD